MRLVYIGGPRTKLVPCGRCGTVAVALGTDAGPYPWCTACQTPADINPLIEEICGKPLPTSHPEPDDP